MFSPIVRFSAFSSLIAWTVLLAMGSLSAQAQTFFPLDPPPSSEPTPSEPGSQTQPFQSSQPVAPFQPAQPSQVEVQQGSLNFGRDLFQSAPPPVPSLPIPAAPASTTPGDPPAPPPRALDPLIPPPPPTSAPAPTQSGRLIGQVFNQSGQPVNGAQIQIGDPVESPEDIGDAALTTDGQGGFELTYDQPGRWMLAVWHPDYELLQTEVWIQPGLTTPVDVVLKTPILSQPRTRLGILGVGGLDHTQVLAQRLAAETVRLGLIPAVDEVVPLDNQRLQPVLREVGWPVYELFEWDRRRPEAIAEFFDYLGLQAIVIARVDVLTRPSSPVEVNLQSRSRLELWTFDESGNLRVDIIAEASRSQTEGENLNGAEISQIYQIQVTEMAEEVRERWGENSPLQAYFDPAQPLLSPQPSRLDTAVELRIPEALR